MGEGQLETWRYSSGGTVNHMNVLILGGVGMLGHKLFQMLQKSVPETWCTVRGSAAENAAFAPGLLDGPGVIPGTDAADWPALEHLLRERRPRVIVNCIGIIKQRAEAKSAGPNIILNALLPHRLAELCAAWDGRLIHFSTDCVFSGDRGHYSETDNSDAHDLYGRTKFLGEVATPNALTLRTSIIGRELAHFQSLLEWVLSQNHRQIKGYTRAIYSGVTTNYMAGLVARLLERQPPLSGLYQVTGHTISKFELLCLLRDAFRLDVDIVPEDSFFCDRSMQGEKFIQATGFAPPPWPELVAQLAADKTPYEEWRRNVRQTV